MEFNELLKVNGVNTKEISEIEGLFRAPKVLVPLGERSGNIADGVFDLMMNPIIRRGSGSINYDVTVEYEKKISNFVKKNQPIEFVFQGFPFKCHNPIETLRLTPDLGEIAFLQRMADINETIKQLYPPGVEFVVLTEGRSYKDLFGASDEEVAFFEERCLYFAEKLNLNKVVKFIDFVEMLNDIQGFSNLCEAEEEKIRSREVFSSTRDSIENLTSIMMRSIPVTRAVPYKDLLAVFGFGTKLEDLSDFQMELLNHLSESGRELAIKYLAIQNTKNSLNVVNSTFSDKLYISTTAKVQKYSFHPIHRRTRLYPHHGVPLYGSDKVDIVFLGEIISNPEIYTAVYYSDDIENAPFYFLKGKQHIKRKNLYNRSEMKRR